MAEDEDKIRRRAYEIWEREGRPDGRQHEHWSQARQEMDKYGAPEGAQLGRGEAGRPTPEGARPGTGMAGGQSGGAAKPGTGKGQRGS
jgi:Protein of unknown function (DUF2934)